MSTSLIVAVLAAVVGLAAGWMLGARRKEQEDPYEVPLRRLADGLADGRVPGPTAGEPVVLEEIRRAVDVGWAPRDAQRSEALKQALGRIAAFLEESVETPLRQVRDGDRELLGEGVDRALGGLKDLEFFLREPITPDETHNLVPLMQQVTREFIADWEVAVRFQAPAFPVRAHIHKATFMDAVYLLLHNAGHFGEGKRIDVRVEAEGDHAVVSILDQGSGFSAEALERARELFYSTRPTALGLGIPFARKIIEGFGGNLEIANRPEGGASVRLVLPGA
ncbi:MAG TPA: HAMP domain-containing sensor histidine kinase [Longimicrobiales bacterium]|nr:HAMP domain-containing sensor histidine kinase [Longimicrobiales bacterium]